MKTVLVIDDDETYRDFMATILEQAGYAVQVAASGTDGLQQFVRSRSDLVIVDIVMEDKDGFETIRDLRQMEPTVKVAVVTGGGAVSAEDYLDFATALGIEHRLIKPFRWAEMLGVVEGALAA